MFVEPSSLPGPRTHKHLLQRGALAVEGRGLQKVVAPTCPGCPSTTCLCHFSVPAVRALAGGRRWPPLVSWRELSCGWGLCMVALWGAASKYGLSEHLVSKGVGVS